MEDKERERLINTMGLNIGAIDAAIQAKDCELATAAFVKFMAAAGFLAQEIDELNNATGN